MKDNSIRNVIFDYLEENNGKIRIFEESPIKNSRCDFYTVTDKLTGYEIKSDADSYERLARQIKDYDAFFDENYIIIGRTHRAHVAEEDEVSPRRDVRRDRHGDWREVRRRAH